MSAIERRCFLLLPIDDVTAAERFSFSSTLFCFSSASLSFFVLSNFSGYLNASVREIQGLCIRFTWRVQWFDLLCFAALLQVEKAVFWAVFVHFSVFDGFSVLFVLLLLSCLWCLLSLFECLFKCQFVLLVLDLGWWKLVLMILELNLGLLLLFTEFSSVHLCKLFDSDLSRHNVRHILWCLTSIRAAYSLVPFVGLFFGLSNFLSLSMLLIDTLYSLILSPYLLRTTFDVVAVCWMMQKSSFWSISSPMFDLSR